MVLRWLKILAPVASLALIAYLGANMFVARGMGALPDSGVPRQGGKLPPFSFQVPDGGTVTRDDLLMSDKPIWLNFWASWCGPCRAEMPDINDIYNEQKGRINLLAVNQGEATDVIRSFMDEGGYTMPVAMDGGSLFYKWGFRYLPTHVFADSRGKVCEIVEGELDRDAMLKALERAHRGC